MKNRNPEACVHATFDETALYPRFQKQGDFAVPILLIALPGRPEKATSQTLLNSGGFGMLESGRGFFANLRVRS